jgi:hypothetical protein
MSYKRLGVAGIAAALLCALSLSAKTSGGSPQPGVPQTISGCCNQTPSGGLTGCVPPPAGGTCPGSMVKANCTGKNTSGGLDGCTAATGARPGRRIIRVPDELKPEGFELEERDGKVVGVAVVKKDGSRMDLTQKPRPTRDTVCPAGTTMVCWYSPGGTMVICYCDKPGGGGGGGGGAISANFSIDIGG